MKKKSLIKLKNYASRSIFVTSNGGQKKQIIPLSFVALFTRVLKPEGCFLIWCPKTVWSGSHRLKAHYPVKLESLRKLRKGKKEKEIYI